VLYDLFFLIFFGDFFILKKENFYMKIRILKKKNFRNEIKSLLENFLKSEILKREKERTKEKEKCKPL